MSTLTTNPDLHRVAAMAHVVVAALVPQAPAKEAPVCTLGDPRLECGGAPAAYSALTYRREVVLLCEGCRQKTYRSLRALRSLTA